MAITCRKLVRKGDTAGFFRWYNANGKPTYDARGKGWYRRGNGYSQPDRIYVGYSKAQVADIWNHAVCTSRS